ncbi:hypothetical protein AK812_SmicGene14484 [Symbiodinium microadriaticum]|uniref:Uncharacterized protein n=1 Tax=Symbiodinium microadriaticum TaxID=2951 RepID=A0A1Q9E5F2_SYMMI|nr:hypothetical protein AK812_SmicGene14484 [Symbiodinium microadriaticum]
MFLGSEMLEKFYEAMYEESSVLTQLLEEAPLLLNPPELQSFVRLDCTASRLLKEEALCSQPWLLMPQKPQRLAIQP